MRKLLTVCGITAVICIFAACSKSNNSTARATTDDTIKVVSYNIRLSYVGDGDGDNRWEWRKPASIKMIEQERPTVIGLQEACPDQLEYLNDNLAEYEYIGVGRDDGKKEGEAMAIFYDTTYVELGRNGTFWLSETPDSVSFGWDAACRRTCTWAEFTLKDSGRKFYMFNTHLDHIGPIARRESIKLITDSINTIAGGLPCYLTADFNTTANDSIFDPLKTIMGQARIDSPISDSLATYNAYGCDKEYTNDTDRVIDHIFYNGLKPLQFTTLNGDYSVPYISDHFPIAFVSVLGDGNINN